jgi:5-methylcytosine-specific restriction endonuclease McrA
MALSYREQMTHPLWIKKRNEILQRDGYACRICGSILHKLEVHHLCYFPDLLAWEYDDELIITVCGKHHTQLTYDMPKISGLIAFECLKKNIDLNTIMDSLKRIKNTNNGL